VYRVGVLVVVGIRTRSSVGAGLVYFYFLNWVDRATSVSRPDEQDLGFNPGVEPEPEPAPFVKREDLTLIVEPGP